MMRLVRIAAFTALAVVIVIGGSAALIAFNQDRIVAYVLASVRTRTGVEIIPRASSVHLGTHLVVVLDQPQVLDNGHEIVKLKSIRALISYHRIFTGTGLPLYRLTATSPEITLPVTATNTAAIALPRPGTPTIDALEEALQALSRICWRVEAVDAAVRYADGVDFANHVGIVAYRTRREPFRWRLGFSGALLEAPVPGAQVSGKFTLGQGENVAARRVWAWRGVDLERTAGRLRG